MSMNKFKNPSYKRWFLQGTIGIITIGVGVSMLLEASHFRHSDPSAWKWVSFGTLSLIVFMAGLVTTIDSVRFRIRYEQEKDDA